MPPSPPPTPPTPKVTCPPVLLPPPLSAARQVFTCTFCWHLSLLPPRVVGRSARLACEECYATLLALSICWVCGEVVVRGDDCVSLGWCFWHKFCYGCLICGNRMVVRGLKVREVFGGESGWERDGGGEDTDKNGREDKGEEERDGGKGENRGLGMETGMGKAVEIDIVPLCAHCYVEVGAEEMDEEKVVGGALRRMDTRDGGVSRRRYEVARCPVPLESTIYVSIRDPTAPGFKPSPTKPIPRWMSRTPEDDDHGTNDNGLRSNSELSGDTLHPSRAELSLRRLSAHTPLLDRTAKPSTPTPEPSRHGASPDTALRRTTEPIITPQPITMDTHKLFRYNRMGFINSESLKRPSSRLDRIREESSTSHAQSRTPSPYLTPPEWPALVFGDSRGTPELEPHAAIQDTTVPEPAIESRDRLSSKPSLLSSSSSQLSFILSPAQTPPPSRVPLLSTISEPSNRPQHSRLPRTSTMLRAKVSAHHPQPLPQDRTAIPMSSEFLERYGLIKGGSSSTNSTRLVQKPSALLKKTPPCSRRQSQSQRTTTAHAHNPNSFMSRMTSRNSRAGATTGPVDETTIVSVTGMESRSVTPKQFSFDSATGSIALHDGSVEMRRIDRSSLQAELRRLLGR